MHQFSNNVFAVRPLTNFKYIKINLMLKNQV